MRSSFLICILLATLLGCSNTDTKSANSKDTDKANTTTTSATPKSDSKLTAKTTSEPKFEFTNAVFETPTIVEFGGDKNYKHGLYPSPALFDVDNDGVNELVLGDLWGKLVACENSNPGKGDPVWSKPEPIKSTNGEPLDMGNW